MILFEYDVCPSLILPAGVHIFVHNRHLYMSVVKSLLESSGFHQDQEIKTAA